MWVLQNRWVLRMTYAHPHYYNVQMWCGSEVAKNLISFSVYLLDFFEYFVSYLFIGGQQQISTPPNF